MEQGKVVFNDGLVAAVKVGNRLLVHIFGEHRPESFPVDGEVDVSGSTIFARATNGHTNLVSDYGFRNGEKYIHIDKDGKRIEIG